MRKDLDRLMQEQGLAGLVVFAYDRYSPAMHYVTGQKLHFGVLARAAGGHGHLIHDPMERDRAAASGYDTSSFQQHGLLQKIESEGHRAGGYARLIAELCASLGIGGPIALLGDLPAGFAYALVARLLEIGEGLSIDTRHPDVLTLARVTKDADEIAALRRAGQATVRALDRLREHLSGLRPDGPHFRSNGSERVRLGDLRRLLRAEFLAHGLAEDGESIVSQGRDAGVPHNRGNDDELLRAGAPLLVDIFPGEAGGGYHSDVTRTWCLGPAPDDLAALHRDVHDAFRLGMEKLALGVSCRSLQEDVCALFEARGHATTRTREGTEEGYVHGLGHGVGLGVHEEPRLGGPPSNTDTIQGGMVVTVEPGLYYPARGLGVRIEDLVAIHPDGRVENLTPAPYDLEIRPRA